MTNRLCRPLGWFLTAIVVLVIFPLVLQAAVPEGWFLAGSKPASYDSGTDEQAQYNGHSSAYLKSKVTITDGFGTLMQNFSAEQYLGKRVRLSAFVKSEDVADWAGLWMRVDKKDSQVVAFDNMQDRPITGTTEWKPYEVVLDVPQNATGIFFGVLLSKTGAVWINSVKFEVVGSDIPVTGKPHPQREAPANLDFEKQ